MNEVHQQRLTVAKSFELSGLGLHSGVPVSVRVEAGEEGLFFSDGIGRWEAIPDNATDTKRSTTIGTVRTVEHLMSALAGSGITDAEVQVTGGELPGADGSALPFYQAIASAGLRQIGERTFPKLFSRVFFSEKQASIGISAGTGQWKFEYQAGNAWPRLQTFQSEDILADYGSEIAPARTFALEEEIPFLAQLQLGQGLDETSAVLVGTSGYLGDVRFGDELARHKLLDAIGDLALSGYPLNAINAVLIKSGHSSHVAAAAKLRLIWQSFFNQSRP